jgi:hypothetical protein
MKLAIADCFFPELRGPAIYKTGRGEGSTPKAAISRAIGAAIKQVKGKRWHTVKVTITVVDKQPEIDGVTGG